MLQVQACIDVMLVWFFAALQTLPSSEMIMDCYQFRKDHSRVHIVEIGR
jgi:hypothetical protein